MISRLGRRALDALLVLFAVLGFCYVPLGKKTGLQHVKALFGTAPAREAGQELLEAGFKVRRTLFGGETPTPEAPANAVVVDAGAPDASAVWP